jgi:hypothetical protein
MSGNYERNSHKMRCSACSSTSRSPDISSARRTASEGVDRAARIDALPAHDPAPGTLRMGTDVFHALKKVLVKRKMSTGVGDEGLGRAGAT